MDASLDSALAGMSLSTLLMVVLWSLPWTAWALWLAARRSDIWWFLSILVLNTLGILAIIYIFLIAKQSDGREPATQHTEDKGE